MSLSLPPHLLEDTGLRSGLINHVARGAASVDLPDLKNYPVRISHAKGKGLHLVASRDIAAGELILQEAPPAAIVRPEWLVGSRFCGGCFADLSPSRAAAWASKGRANDSSNELCEECEQSSRIRYLDRKLFWRDIDPSGDDEEEVSDRLSTLKVSSTEDANGITLSNKPEKRDNALAPEEIDDSLFRFFQRVVFNWDAQLSWKYPSLSSTGSDDLSPIVASPQHIMILSAPHLEHPAIEAQINTFVELLDSHLHLVGLDSQKKALDKLIRTAFHNAHEIADSSAGASIGMGIYPIASLLNHACGTAAKADWKIEAGGSMPGIFIATARQDIKEGEEIRIEYGKFDESLDSSIKQEYVMKTWRFRCDCPICAACWLCRDPKLDTLKCTGCGVACYCSRDHQKADWKPKHKEWCGFLRDLKTRCEDSS